MAAANLSGGPPATLPVNAAAIPDDLTPWNQWIGWRWEWREGGEGREGKWTKPPLRATGNGYAKSNDPSTWTSFDAALRAYQQHGHPGIGLVLTKEDPFFFVDLDDSRDPVTGHVADWAQPILRAFRHTYCEVSPTSTGIKILGKGRKPGGSSVKNLPYSDRAKIEIYDGGGAKYTTITGQRYHDAAEHVVDAQDALDALYAQLWPETPAAEDSPRPRHTENQATGDGDDQDGDDDHSRLKRARAAKNGEEFRRLFDDGDLSAYRGDHSAADQALANMLAFWFGPDPARIERVFRDSKLMRPKCDQKHAGDGRTYLTMTIDTALAGRTDFYTPKAPPLRVFRGGRDDRHDRGSNGAGGRSLDSECQRPVIDAGDADLERTSAQAWNALQRANRPPRMFRFGGLPVRVERMEEDSTPIAQTLTEDRLSHELARAASWFKTTEKGDEKPAAPPPRLLKDLLAFPTYPLPALNSIVQVPVFAPDGSLSTTPGYHPAGGVIYAPVPGFAVPAIPETPTVDDVAQAKTLIVDELLVDFPFCGEAERANAVALFLDRFVRNMVNGPTPLRLIEAPDAGTGKGLLADVLLRVAVGTRVNIMPAANDDDEWRKRITAQLSLLPEIILIDNVVTSLESGSLAAVLTTESWIDRRLGVSEMVQLPNRCAWVATANNPTMSTEIARRAVRIRLDAKMDRPWMRQASTFRHENLREWTDEHRAELVWSALVLVQHWIAEGSPAGTQRLGTFEHWSSVLGGILGCAGIDGFLGNLETFYEEADLEGAIWRQFVAAWFGVHGESVVGVNDLFEIANTVEGFDFGKGAERAQKTSFGIKLNRQRDRVIDKYRVVNTGTVNRVKRWRLIQAREGDNPFATFYEGADANHQHDEDAGDDRWTS